MSVKLEYLLMDFGSSKAVSPDAEIYDFEHSMQTLKLGLNFHLPPY